MFKIKEWKNGLEEKIRFKNENNDVPDNSNCIDDNDRLKENGQGVANG